MKLVELVLAARELYSAKRVYGEPVERDGVVVIPAAMVMGGGGGGVDGEGKFPGREGAGFGLLSRPTGAFVIRGGSVTWVPALDTTLLVLAGTTIALAFMHTLQVIAKSHRRLS